VLNMKRNQGFTLVELIIVIVILGILAVTAAPRFLNFSGDARASTLSGVRGALESAGALVYGKALIEGKHTQASGENLNAPFAAVSLIYGYPADADSLRAAAELSIEEWEVLDVTTANEPVDSAAGDVVIAPEGATLSADLACHVLYKPATASTGTPVVVTKPVITVYAAGC
jgi:MSHA pilin protein MshA